MFKTRSARGLALISILGLLTTGIWWLSGKAQRPQGNTHTQDFPIDVSQLPASEGIIPLMLRCVIVENVTLTGASGLRCTVTNNTTRPISALTLAYEIAYEAGSQKSVDGGFMTLDALVHPDFSELNANKFIQPGAERVIQRGGPLEQDTMARGVKVRVDYVEFADGSSLGPNARGSVLVTQIRRGAAEYKRWLQREYLDNGKPISAVVPLLQEGAPLELKVDHNLSLTGAQAYRKSARELLNTGGITEIEKRLRAKDKTEP